MHRFTVLYFLCALVFSFNTNAMFSPSKKRSSNKRAPQSIEKDTSTDKRASLEFGDIIDEDGSRTYKLKEKVNLDYVTTKKVIEEMLKWEKYRSDVPFKGRLCLNQKGLVALGEAFIGFDGHTNLKQLSISFDKDVNTGSIIKSVEFLKYVYFLQSLHLDFTNLNSEISTAFTIYVRALTHDDSPNFEVLHVKGPKDLASYLLGISLVADGKVKNLIFSGLKPPVLGSTEGITLITDKHQTIIKKSDEPQIVTIKSTARRITKSVSLSNSPNQVTK